MYILLTVGLLVCAHLLTFSILCPVGLNCDVVSSSTWHGVGWYASFAQYVFSAPSLFLWEPPHSLSSFSVPAIFRRGTSHSTFGALLLVFFGVMYMPVTCLVINPADHSTIHGNIGSLDLIPVFNLLSNASFSVLIRPALSELRSPLCRWPLRLAHGGTVSPDLVATTCLCTCALATSWSAFISQLFNVRCNSCSDPGVAVVRFTWCACTPPVFLSTPSMIGRPSVVLPLAAPAPPSHFSALSSSVRYT